MKKRVYTICVAVCLMCNAAIADSIASNDPDPQEKGAIGAGLMTGGAALLGSIIPGFGTALAGAFAGGFQIGYGGGMVAKGISEKRRADANFKQPVSRVALTINPLPNPTGEPAAVANSANAAMQNIGSFLSDIRALGTAQDRYVSAVAANNQAAASMQFTAATMFLRDAQQSLLNTSTDLSTLASAVQGSPWNVTFDVAAAFSTAQSNLSTGIPADEQAFASQYQLSPEEETQFITMITGFTPTQAVDMYGSNITLQDLIEQLSTNSATIANNLPAEVNFIPEPNLGIIAGCGLIAAFLWRRRTRHSR